MEGKWWCWAVVVDHGRSSSGSGGHRRPCALVIRRWALVAFVGGGARSGWLALFVGAGFLFMGAELSFLGGGARSGAVHVRGWGAVVGGQVVRGCGVVVCGRGGAVSCVVWSPLARSGTKVDEVLTFIDNVNENDALGDVAAGTPHALVASMRLALVHLVTWCCHVVLAVVVMGVGDGCEWQRLVTVRTCCLAHRGW
ncbi:hypothetical protein K443DRAFT_14663 [Laccaria amethystina LaAM-08-1]|uniref:Uncharacterized protein n=1 Tax=Laccaria amethystina LaAM-08-1 TaxID=1095629 RepID=A0A0C9WMH5_9AGAR|nr:hypothetical protein K443DRAFT_14663 [Laccaria amethystina LaAM-08-1]